MFKKFMPMVNTTLGPTSVTGKTDITSYSIPAGWVTQTVTQFASCLQSDGERWEKVIECLLNGMDDIHRCHTRRALP